MVKILCLHGFKTSATVMQFQLQWLRNTLYSSSVAATSSKTWEFRFVNAPHEIPEEAYEKSILKYFKPPFYEWLNLHVNEENLPSSRQQWPIKTVDPRYFSKGLAESIDLIRRVIIDEGPFDILCGFSQGCSIVTLATCLLLQQQTTGGKKHGNEMNIQEENQNSSADFSELPKSKNSSVTSKKSPALAWSEVVPWKMNLYFNGVNPKRVLLGSPESLGLPHALKQGSISFPSIHVIGEDDPLQESSKELVDIFKTDGNPPVCIFTPEPHHPARKKKALSKIAAQLAKL
eukprot:g4205.t1